MPARAATIELRWRIAGSGNAWTSKSVKANTSTIKIEGLERGKSYEGEARALSAAGTPSDWAPVNFTVADTSLAPRAPTGLTVLSVADAVSLKWSVDAEQPADVEYSVETATASGGPYSQFTRTRARQFSVPFTDSTVRWFRVRAVTFGVVFSGYSNIVSAAAISVAALEQEIAEALETAQNAQATADGNIQSFWQASPPTISSVPGGAKVGDIWFDTNDGNKIYRVVGGIWEVAQDDQIAQAIASAAGAQATADGKVKTFYQSSAPTATGVGDLWYNTTTGKLFRWNGSNWTNSVGDSTLDQLSGAGQNLVPYEYSYFSAETRPLLIPTNGATTPSWSAITNIPGGESTYSITVASAGSAEGFYFGKSATDYNTAVETKKYLLSFYVRCNVAGHVVAVSAKKDDDGTFTEPVSFPLVGTGWNRVSRVIDLTSSPNTRALIIHAHINTSGVAGREVRIQGMMLEPLVGIRTEPSAFIAGIPHGKNKTFRQSTTPVGSAVGDIWYNTSTKVEYRWDGTGWVQQNWSLDNAVDDGSSYIRYAIEDGYFSGGKWRNGLRINASKHQISGAFNFPPGGFANVGAAWVSGGSASYTATAGSPATATISVSALTLRSMGTDIAYSASSVGVTGTNGSTVTYHLYYDDDTFAGGARTLGATTSMNTIVNSRSRLYIVSIAVAFPSSGSGGGSKDPWCATVDSVLACGRRAGAIRIGDWLRLADPYDGLRARQGRVSRATPALAPCVRLTTDLGAVFEGSTSAPIPTRDGYRNAPDTEGCEVPVRRLRWGVLRPLARLLHRCDWAWREGWERVVRVDDIGEQWVMHITCENSCFWVGKHRHAQFLHHNIKHDP